MATDAQTAANIANAQASTGPRSPAGKDNSSRNAITLGLFTLHDFVRPGERDEYSQMVSGLHAQLTPQGALEDAFAAAIIGAIWRLRRCSLVEARMTGARNQGEARNQGDACELDPMEDDSASHLQISVDRARAQSHNLLRRSMSELRRLTGPLYGGLSTANSKGHSPRNLRSRRISRSRSHQLQRRGGLPQ